MIDFNNCTPEELALAAEALALALAKDRSSDYINVLGNLLVAVGSIMLTIAAQQQNIKSMQESMNNKNTKG